MSTSTRKSKPKSKKRDAKFAADMAKDPNMGFNPKAKKRSLKG